MNKFNTRLQKLEQKTSKQAIIMLFDPFTIDHFYRQLDMNCVSKKTKCDVILINESRGYRNKIIYDPRSIDKFENELLKEKKL